MPDHNYFANLIWQIADLLRGPYRPPQYERVMLPMTVLRRFDCVLVPTKSKVLAEHERRKGGRLNDDALDRILNNAAGQRFHNHSPLDFEKLKDDPDHIEAHLSREHVMPEVSQKPHGHRLNILVEQQSHAGAVIMRSHIGPLLRA